MQLSVNIVDTSSKKVCRAGNFGWKFIERHHIYGVHGRFKWKLGKQSDEWNFGAIQDTVVSVRVDLKSPPQEVGSCS
jgi:hypothetical protein